jgi:catechol 2,3-dioxygenase-like lactoylglutathione lyase family enzyme
MAGETRNAPPAMRLTTATEETPMAKIRHLAFFSDSPEKMAEFYVNAFGFEIKGRGKASVWITDGYLDIALLKRGDDSHVHSGLNHFGVTLEADERDAVYQRLDAMGRSVIKPPPDRSYVEDYCKDVDGNKFDISTSGVKANKEKKMVFKEPAKV